MRSVVSSKGQITLPAVLREKLGLAGGTPVEFELRDGGLFVRKGVSDAHPVDRLFGQLKLEAPVDDLLDAMRGPRPAAARGLPRRTGRRRR